MCNYPITDEELDYIKSIDKPFSQTLWNYAQGNLKRYLFNFTGAWKHFTWEDSELIEKRESSPEMKKWNNIFSSIKWDKNEQKVIDIRSEEDKKLTFYEMYHKEEDCLGGKSNV